MPREKPCFRVNAQRLREVFPEKELLTSSDLAKFCGICIRTARKKFDLNRKKRFISIEDAARLMSESV